MPFNAVSPATTLTYANLQMAAEATRLARVLSGELSLEDVLVLGNDRSSRFTPTQAAEFASEWRVAAHRPNTGTGFSGPVFEYTGPSDPDRGLTTGQRVICFRSTEFADDAARDNQATNVMEVREFGWAIGQIADARKWFNELNAPGGALTGRNFVLTGYSLGANIAAGLNYLLAESGQGSRISATYTFNGAGFGDILPGRTLTQVIEQFDGSRHADQSSIFSYAPARDFYNRQRSVLNGEADVATRTQALRELTTLETELGAGSTAANTVALGELRLLRTAIREALRFFKRRNGLTPASRVAPDRTMLRPFFRHRRRSRRSLSTISSPSCEPEPVCAPSPRRFSTAWVWRTPPTGRPLQSPGLRQSSISTAHRRRRPWPTRSTTRGRRSPSSSKTNRSREATCPLLS